MLFRCLKIRFFPDLLGRAGDEFRIWIAGCATGEEAYSIAMLVSETAEKINYFGKITVFATDVHQRSLNKAAAGEYTSEQIKNLSERRKVKYFTKMEDDVYKISSDLRKMIIFAPHNAVQEPPFTRLDFVSCRNLLIYLKSEAQEKLISLFYFSLKINGILFLGASEGLGRLSDEFIVENSTYKLFRKIRAQMKKVDIPRIEPRAIKSDLSHIRGNKALSITIDQQILEDYDQLLNRYIPSGVLVDSRYNIMHYFGDIQKYLKPLKGRVEIDLLKVTESDLQLAIRVGLQRAAAAGKTITIPECKNCSVQRL